uniref:START domain-containing protein n=1 Tax=Phytophthora ramorum TaxID=164328 RepID=H3HCC0_PHYRM
MASLQMQRSACQPISDTLTEDQTMWKSVAAIAKQARQNSQDESVRLKNELQMCARGFEMLQAQLITAESFRQQLEGNRLAFANSFRIGMISSQRLCFDDSGIYELLEQRINARLHELDSIVRETCHLPTGGFTENVQVCREDASTTVVEFQHVRLLPFGGDATASTIWDIINMGGLVAKENTYVTRSASDMVGLVSRHVIPLGNMASAWSL